MKHTLPELGYAYDALEPYIDARTMEIHHTKHHQGYINKLNAALEGHAALAEKSAEELVSNLDEVPQEIRTAVRNQGGGHVNHTFFWKILKKGVEFKGEIAEAITAKYGSLDQFKKEFAATAMSVFGSGWAWLVIGKGGEIQIMGTSNQDSPLSHGKTPVLGLDVWEHAYYLKYQSLRNEYIEAFFNVIDWEAVNENYKKTREVVATN
ncbi:MAG TPA: superoxide dismutase [candidate division Zixibacteria bacterium]|nr:superoxide dismutase [candidate division Zixibacteria bacterium]